MQYKFSQFTGRLNTPPHLDIPTKYVQYTERPKYQFILETPTSVNDHPYTNTTRARRLGGGKYYAPVPDTLLKKMRLFQLPNKLPVHVKGGPIDKVLYGITSAVCLLGTLECFRVYYILSYPPNEGNN